MNTTSEFYNGFDKLKDEFSPKNSILISADKNFETKDFTVYNADGFFEYIIRKSPLFSYPKTLSPQAGSYILQSIIKQSFKNNSALNNLTKSTVFSKELYDIFEKFTTCKFSAETLENAIKSTDIDTKDKERLSIIFDTYKIYLEKLKELNYVQKSALAGLVQEILSEYPVYLNSLKEKIKNIILLGEKNEFSKDEFAVFSLFENTKFIPQKITAQTEASQILEAKYINQTTPQKPETPDKLRLLIFNDARDEAGFIANEITEKIKTQNASLKDFSVLVPNSDTLKIFNEIFNTANIPCNLPQKNPEYLKFTTKLLRYFSICSNLILLEQTNSKAKSEALSDEINLNFENLLTDALGNQFIKEQFLSILENSSEKSLPNCVKNNLHILNKTDAASIKTILKNIEICLYYLKNEQYTEFTAYLQKSEQETSEEFQIACAQLIKNLKNLKKLNLEINQEKIPFGVIAETLTLPPKTLKENKNCVKILNIKNSIRTKYTYISGLTDNAYPNNANNTEFVSPDTNLKISDLLNELNPNFDFLTETQEKAIKESAVEFINALNKSENITVCTHSYEDKKQTLPSIFFQYLSSFYSAKKIDFSLKTFFKQEQLGLNFSTVTPNAVLANTNIHLSPSAISDFQKCPRKFYYAHLLGLKKTETFATSYGIIAHSIMELFNKNCLENYTKSAILELTNLLFNSINEPQKAIAKGFSENEISLLQATDLLSLEEMKTNFLNAVNELEKNKFFEEKPLSVISEKGFSFTLEEIPDITFIGRIDAIYEFSDKFVLVDFKTGKTLKSLNKLICKTGVNLLDEDDNLNEKAVNEFLYQIPVYYLACENSEELNFLKGKTSQLGLLYIRPTSKDGVEKDFVSGEQLKTFAPQIIENLKTTIIEKLRTQKTFECKFDEFLCKNCGFESLCDKKGGDYDD